MLASALGMKLQMKYFSTPALIVCLILLGAAFSLVLPQTGMATALPLHVSGSEIVNPSNQVVVLRGIGRVGDLQSASGMWSGPGTYVATWDQMWQPIRSNVELIDATFSCYQQFWHVNMIRMLIPVNWYWQNTIVPAQQDPGNYPTYTATISYQTYVATVARESAKYGIYVDVCPYELLSNYQDSNKDGAQGQPMGTWDSDAQSFLNSTGLTEQEFWSQYWTLMASNLKGYGNVIFEAWNEPENLGNDSVTPSYLTYLTAMYDAIRGAGAQNLIFMQWDSGYLPNYNDLSWARQISNAIPNAENLVFTTHAYRHGPDFNPEWGTSYDAVEGQLQAAVQSMGINAPLVINEAGSCMFSVPNDDVKAELTWWEALNQAAAKLGIGVTAYYWLSDSDLGYAFSGETLLQGTWTTGAVSPTPNEMGQIFLNTAPGTKSSTLTLAENTIIAAAMLPVTR